MVTWQLDVLKQRYEDMSGEALTYRQIADGSGISKSTVWKILNNQSQVADFGVMSKLLAFFSDKLGKQLELEDILEYTPEKLGT